MFIVAMNMKCLLLQPPLQRGFLERYEALKEADTMQNSWKEAPGRYVVVVLFNLTCVREGAATKCMIGSLAVTYIH